MQRTGKSGLAFFRNHRARAVDYDVSPLLRLNFCFDLTLPRFHVHQIAGKLKMNGGRDEQERTGSKPAVYG